VSSGDASIKEGALAGQHEAFDSRQLASVMRKKPICDFQTPDGSARADTALDPVQSCVGDLMERAIFATTLSLFGKHTTGTAHIQHDNVQST
jgi:hypothetical protein